METAIRTPDAELVRRLRGRERSAWEELYAGYQPRLRALAFRLSGNVHDADDLVQETFVRAVPRLAEVDPATADVAAYLFATLRNVFLKQVERRQRTEPVAAVPEPMLPAPLEDDPERSMLLTDQQTEVRAANAKLQPRQRLVLALRELEDRSYAEIGELVGMKENAVAQLIFRARESLRTELRLAQVAPDRLPRNCREFLPQLAAHLDGQLKDRHRDATLAHLEGCDRCQAALADMREASRRYRSLPLLPSAAEARAATETRLDEVAFWAERRGRRIGRRTAVAASVGWLVALLVGGAAVAEWVSGGDRPMLAAAGTTAVSESTDASAPPTASVAAAQRTTTAARTTGRPSLRMPTAVATTTATLRVVPTTTPASASTTRRPPTTMRPPISTRTSPTPPRPTTTTAPPPPPPDTTPPTARIVSAPPDRTEDRGATFAFAADESGATFRCSLDGAAETSCSSPVAYGPLAVGPHTFSVHALDRAGNVGAAARYAWTVFERLPDLVASLGKFGVVVTNRGDGPAGPSVLTVTPVGTFTVPALAAGTSVTFSWSTCRVGVYTAVVDRANAVRESDESNNSTSRRNTCP